MDAGALFATFLTVLAMDAVWLTFRYSYHASLFQSIQKSPLEVRIVPAFLIYLLLPFALYIWAIQSSKSIGQAAAKGALVGGIMYGFYDLTNYATLTKWTLEMSIIDVLWGIIVCSAGAASGFSFLRKV
jgi:uncharacterized membrane protein